MCDSDSSSDNPLRDWECADSWQEMIDLNRTFLRGEAPETPYYRRVVSLLYAHICNSCTNY